MKKKGDGTRIPRIEQPPEIMAQLELDPIFEGLLDEFEFTLKILQSVVVNNPSLIDMVASRLCELSRDMRFRIYPADCIPPDRIKNVVGLFQKVSCLLGRSSHGIEVDGYLKSIQCRINDLKVALEEPPLSADDSGEFVAIGRLPR